MTFENTANDYVTSDHYEEIQDVAPQATSPRFSAMAGHAVLSHAESDAPNIYGRISDLNASGEQYNANKDQDHHTNAKSFEPCYLELQP